MDLLARWQRSIAAIAFGLFVFPPVWAQNATEDNVKAVFILNFTRFVKWPATSLRDGEPVTLCAETSQEMINALEESVKDKSLDGHSFAVRRLTRESDLHACQVAFFTGNATIKPAAGVLTVLDDGARAANSDTVVITLVLASNRIRFEVNNRAAERAGLVVSSQLLSLALRVDQ